MNIVNFNKTIHKQVGKWCAQAQMVHKALLILSNNQKGKYHSNHVESNRLKVYINATHFY